MSGYTHSRKITVDNSADPLPRHLAWRKTGHKYMIRSNGGSMQTRIDHVDTLTEARKVARARISSGASTWSEVFRWAENGVMIKSIFVCSYERELVVT